MRFKSPLKKNQPRADRRRVFSLFEHEWLERRDVPASSIYAQVGSKVVANSYNVGDGGQHGEAVAVDANGVTTVVWTDGVGAASWYSGLDGSYCGIYARKIDASGSPIGNQFRINQKTLGVQQHPAIGLDGSGNAVVAYANFDVEEHLDYITPKNWDIRVQRINADNTRGAEVIIPAEIEIPIGTEQSPKIKVDRDGSFTVAYTEGKTLKVRRYGPDNVLISSSSLETGISLGEGEQEAVGFVDSYSMADDGSVVAITTKRVSKFVIDVGTVYQDRVVVDKMNANGVRSRDVLIQSSWDSSSTSKLVTGSPRILALSNGGYIWFKFVQHDTMNIIAETRKADGTIANGPVEVATNADNLSIQIIPGTSNLLLTCGKYVPWEGTLWRARILDSQANPLTGEFSLWQNSYGDTPIIGFASGNANRFVATWNDEHPWLPGGNDSATGVPLVWFEQITAHSVMSFATSSSEVSEGARSYQVTINRAGELRAAPYTAIVTASSTDFPSSQFTTFQQKVEFAAGESSKTIDLYWSGDSVQNPTRHIKLNLSDPTGIDSSLGATTDFILNVLDDDGPPNVAPTIQPISNKTIKAGDTLKVQAVATDSNVPAQKLTYSLTAAPADAMINPTTGEITWVGKESATPASFQVKVTDNGTPALSASASFQVTVNPKTFNTAPVFQPISNQSVVEGDLLVVQAKAIDSDVPAQKLTYSFLVAPVEATINPQTGEIKWTAAFNGVPGEVYYAVFQIQVADNGSPTRTDYTSFQVAVTPKLATLPTQLVELNTITSGKVGFGSLLIRFSRELNSATATNLKNYKFISAGKDKKFGTKDDKVVTIKSAALVKSDSKMLSVQFKTGLPVNDDYRLTVTALKDKSGKLVDGDKNGTEGGTITAYIRKGVITV